jgi:uncharacterized protein with FMN-binding domain
MNTSTSTSTPTAKTVTPRKRHAARKTRLAVAGLSLVTTGILTQTFATADRADAAVGTAAATSYTGAASTNRWGTVQVRLTVSGGKITNITTLQLPSSKPKSVRLSNNAVSIIKPQVISAQSTNVNTVSGATLTSRSYLTSIQSAIDTARAAGALS